MAMFNTFPATYQNPYYQPVTPQQNAQNNNSIIWVQGEAGAKSYLVAPNTTVQLWDSEEQVIYLKSADASGMPTTKIIDYTIRGTETPVNALTSESNINSFEKEINAVKSDITALKEEVARLKPKKRKDYEEDYE